MFEIYNLDFSHIVDLGKQPEIDEFTFILIEKLKEVFTKIVPTPLPGVVLSMNLRI